MASIHEIMQLCRLCLVKEQVNTPIFEEVDDISQTFLKISTCLPVKVSRDDTLPKNICDSCSYKLELFYEFWNTSANSEKQLTKWLSQLGVNKSPSSKAINTLAPSSQGLNVNPMILKQEVPELVDPHTVDNLVPSEDLNVCSDAQDYVLQQPQQLPYEAVEFEFQQESFMDSQTTANVASTANLSKEGTTALNRKRHAAVLDSLSGTLEDSEDEDVGLVGPKITKTEGDIEDENDEIGNDITPTSFVDLPSTSGDNDQPGPSGVGKTAADAPVGFLTYGQLAVFTKLEDQIDLMYSSDNQEKENDVEDDVDDSVDSFSLHENDENFEEFQFMEIDEKCLKDVLKPNYNSGLCQGKAKQVKKKYSLCSICGKYVAMLEKHMRVYHGTFKCDICITAFRTEQELEAHKELHGNNEYPCSECTLSFKKPVDYAYHSKEHCALKTYKCPLCQFKTPSRGSVKIHIQHHEKDYKYTCEICNRGFISNAVYTEHVEGHAGIKRFQCDICFKTFLYKRYLMVHRKLNHKKILEGYEDINECHVCQRKFSFEKSLIRHLSKIHGIGKDVSVDCTVCNKKIANPYNLKMHMRTHTGEKPYVCETCGKAFTKRVNLRRHLHNLHD